MNKKDYIEAVNEIKVGDNMKKKTFNKIREKKSYKSIYALVSLAMVCLIAISIIIPIRNNNKTKGPANNQVIIDSQEEKLPRVGSFETLYKIMKENLLESDTKGGMIQSVDLAIAESTAESTALNDSDSEKTNMDYSTTNVQVEGVDEADIVKTDGEYIYYVRNNKITIVNSRDLTVVSELKYEQMEKNDFYPKEIFIKGNKLIVIGNRTVYEKNNEEYYYYYPNSKTFTSAIVYEISDKSNPKNYREIEIEGNYVSSRMVGENVYLISNKYMYWYLFGQYGIDELKEEDYKPQYIDTAISQDTKYLDFESIYYFPESEDTSYLNIAGFNVNNNQPANIQSYLGAGSEIYASEKNLYITRVKYNDTKNFLSEYVGYDYDINTYIYKFKLDGSTVTYIADGKVPGSVLNQFSMDEKSGFFRIATTDSKSWDGETNRNNLYVLNENLEIVGKVEDLAKGERIYSVRFMGNRAYMVTFVETDPLFVIDLSEPTNPTVLGELKIPGYSKYLHPYDETHIIGFGEDTKTVNSGYGDRVVTDGMKMALFDVKDPTNPKEMYSIKIGDRGTYSELLYNHKALLFSKEKNIIAFPISICKDASSYRSNLRFQGAIIYGIDLEKGFILKGQIAHMQIEKGYMDYDYTKAVERIIYVKDTLFTLSEGLIKATDMSTMKELNNVELETEKDTYREYYIN